LVFWGGKAWLAIFDATAVTLREIPFTPERVKRAVENRSSK
jgi:CO/xanthine dehydrogenase Mo-binding subunit